MGADLPSAIVTGTNNVITGNMQGYGYIGIVSKSDLSLNAATQMFITAGNFTQWYYVYIDAARLTIGSSSSCATYFMGDVTISGTRTMFATSTTATFKVLNYTTSLNNTSDSRLKKNISPINALISTD